jgi:hypothetical protein
MALPPLELFSLKKRLPCCRVAFSFFRAASAGLPRSAVAPVLYASRGRRYNPKRYVLQRRADVAQLVEQLIRNQQVIGSSPIVGSMSPSKMNRFLNFSRHNQGVSHAQVRAVCQTWEGKRNLKSCSLRPNESAKVFSHFLCLCFCTEFGTAYPLFFSACACGDVNPYA